MAAIKGHPKYGGRKKGSKNKAEKIRMQFFKALAEVGGKDFMVETAKKEPVPFLRCIVNLLPSEIEADIAGELTIKWEQS